MTSVALKWFVVSVSVCAGVLIGLGYAPVAIGSAVALAFAVLSAHRPWLAPLVYAATRPLVDLFVFVPVGPFTLGQVWGAGLIAVIVWYWISAARGGASLSVLTTPLVMVGAYMVMSLAHNEPVLAITGALKLATWTLLVATVWDVAKVPDRDVAIVRMGVLTSLSSLVAIGAVLVLDQYGRAYYAGESLGYTQGPHGIASTAVMCVPFLLVAASRSSKPAVYAGLIGLLGAGIAMSLVRTTMVALVIVLTAYVVWLARERGWRAVRALALSGVVGLVLVVALQESLLSRIDDLRFLSQGGSAAYWAGGGRIGIWIAGLETVLSDWAWLLFGMGPQASFGVSQAAMGSAVWAHNDFLELLLTGGVLLLCAYVGVLWWLVYPFLRQGASGQEDRAPLRLLGLGVVAAFVFMAFFNGMFQYQASVVAAMFLGYSRGMCAMTADVHVLG